ncbi:unnamed protein product [Tuber melanosporum]|uniref:HET-C domain protein n=2 Tax=Tuber melanosporum TaxID=39416 RepID=H6VQH1_TUBME|nr:uncharacterized protein GSTUM_00005021001 [Tuber melanosporum]AFB74449.1 HET-C domain protein [Tuber melanosporum]CAZ81245.1 unnamed protein product [Tuber melanosporum]
MAGSTFSSPMLLPLCLVLIYAALPAHAFGAGNIASVSTVEGQNWRHGDIEDALLSISMAAVAGGKRFSFMDVKRVYFGNWLRDYSQAVDVGALKYVEGPTVRLLLSILSFMTFGYATGEFEVTDERLGCYRPEEHIDNPKDYADNEDARRYDPRLRGPVDEATELSVDPQTGMKNYIANERIRNLRSGDPMCTSAGLVRHLFGRSIQLARNYGQTGNKAELYEALRLMGTGLHCLEDFSAHSNYIELALIELGETDVFPHVGSRTRCEVNGRMIYPLVTGTFGGVDFLHSVLGEASDKLIQSEVEQLESTITAASAQSSKDGGEHGIIRDLLKQLKIGGSDDLDAQATNLEQQSEAKKNEPWGISNGGAGIKREIMPFLEWHDKIMKAINEALESIPGLTALVEKLSEAVSVFVFSLLAPYILPIVAQAKGELANGSGEVIGGARAKQFVVFEDHYSSDPTHSMLSKDHFTNLLNEPAGKVASETVKFVVPLLMQAWDGNSDPNWVLDQIIPIFHHPAFVDGSDGCGRQEGRHRMFGIIRQWWEEMDESRKQFYRRSLSGQGVEQGKNHKEGHDSGHGCGKPIHRTKPKNSGGEFCGIGEDLGKAMGGAIEQALTGSQSGGSGLGGFLGGVAATALGETLLGGSASGGRNESYSERYDDGNARSADRSYSHSGRERGQRRGEGEYGMQVAGDSHDGGKGYAAAVYSAGGEYGYSEQRYGQNYSRVPIYGGVEYGSGDYDGGESFVVPDHDHHHHHHHHHHHQPEGHSHHHHHYHEQPTYERTDSYGSNHPTDTPSYSRTSSYASESSYSVPAAEYPYIHPHGQYGEYPTNASYRTETYTQSSSYGGGQSSYQTSTRQYPGSRETREVVYSGEGDEGYVVERSYKKYSDGEEERKYKSYRRGEESEDECEEEERRKKEKKWKKKHEGSGDEGSGDEYYGSGDEDGGRRYSGSGDEDGGRRRYSGSGDEYY